MASELQRLVDSLGNRLGRSVAIDDAAIQLLAYTSHVGEVDEARLRSIMQRHVPRSLLDYLDGLDVKQSSDLFSVPAQADLGLNIARVGMPVRHQGGLLGYLWLLASDGPVTDEVADALRSAAETAGLIMHREYLVGELERRTERELVRDLLSGDPRLHEDAAARLVEDDLFVAGTAAVLTVTLVRHDGAQIGEKDRLALAAGLDYARRRLPARHAIALERPDHGVLVVSRARPGLQRDLAGLGAAVHERVLAESGCAPDECWVGIGEQRATLAQIHESHREARQAARVACIIRVLGPVVQHSRLGVYTLLAELPPDRLRHSVPAGLWSLLDSRDHGNDTLISTLETFLDNASDVKRTAEQLCVHRATLYYRLRRIEEITQVSLDNGNERLVLHLGLKVARLIEVL